MSTNTEQLVTGVDFVGIPTHNLDAAVTFTWRRGMDPGFAQPASGRASSSASPTTRTTRRTSPDAPLLDGTVMARAYLDMIEFYNRTACSGCASG